jgi:TIR domain
MSQPPKFFITHSSKDMKFARRLSDDLHAARLTGFFDVYSIKPGDDFVARINRGLEECDVFVPILSSAALKSPWCEAEINAALTLSNDPSRQGRPRIIPVLIEHCAAELPPLLRQRHYIDFAGPRADMYLPALWQLLEKGFGVDPATFIYRANMYSGPRIQTGVEEGDHVWWGACQVVTFSQKDSGKTLRVSVVSDGNDLSVELWRGAYDGKDVGAWLKERVEVARTPRGRNPTLAWEIEVGTYTIYLVDYVCLKHHIREGPRGYWAYEMYPIREYDILYRIEIL